MELFEINVTQLYENLVKLLISFLLPMMTAWEREADSRSAGLRTFPLVSMAACSFTILAMTMFVEESAQARIIGGVVTGIGFIGGGAILKDKNNVTGLSTAAALWATGAVGIAIGLGRLEIAIALSLMMFIIFQLLGSVKEKIED